MGLASSYNIDCCHKKRIFQITPRSIIAATGLHGDLEASGLAIEMKLMWVI
jgi:hypothetical protein